MESSESPNTEIKHVFREGNEVVNGMAKIRIQIEELRICEENFPSKLLEITS